jgi:hypothetical protein
VALIGLAVEGVADAAAGRTLLRSVGHDVDPARLVVARGKSALDPRIPSLNQAARHLPWLVLRDADRDADDCPAALRASLLDQPQEAHLCLRLAVRSLEAWLLADPGAFSAHFRVPKGRLPAEPELEIDAKRSLVRLCRASGSRAVRNGMTRPASDHPGPEYSAMLTEFAREAWRPLHAVEAAPSLSRAFADVAARFD